MTPYPPPYPPPCWSCPPTAVDISQFGAALAQDPANLLPAVAVVLLVVGLILFLRGEHDGKRST